MSQVNCLGILVVDALSGPLPHYPTPRVQSQVITDHVQFLPGGGASNTPGALGRMGVDVGVFSKIGDDPNGAFLLKELGSHGVDTRGIHVSAYDSTPFTFVGIHPDGDRSFVHTPGANKTFCCDDLDLDRLYDASYLLYQDLWVLPHLDGVPGAGLLAEAQRRGVITLLDECWGLGPQRATFELMLPYCDYVLPSVDDMQAIYPDMSAEAIARHLLALGVGTVVLKMGAQGCLVARQDEMNRIPAFTVPVVDTTGAGDCWDAGFIAGLLHGEDVLAAARIGNACSSFCIGHIGGATGVPDYATVYQRAMAGFVASGV